MATHSHHDHDHDHGHSHAHLDHRGAPGGAVDMRIALAVALNLAFVAIEIVYGLNSNSIALIADAGHNFGDVLGLLLAWGAMALARRPAGGRFTYGLGRSSVLAALANSVLLFIACGAIAWESLGRIMAPLAVAGVTVMWVAGAGILINGISAYLLHAGNKDDMNMRAAFLHMVADAAVSAGVVAAGFVIQATGLLWIDPAVSLAVILVILYGSWGLLRDSVHLSLDGVPASVNSAAVRDYLAGHSGVAGVHDLHIWALSTTNVALTAHIIVPGGDPEGALLEDLTAALKRRFRIDHATLQIEQNLCAHGCDPQASS
jgi:cobalt-zinc-cadmium efflux system protein